MLVPRQQFVDAVDLMFGDTAKDIRQPSLRVNVIELGGLNERIGRRRGSTTRFGSGEKPIFPADRYSPHTPLCWVVVDAKAAVIEIRAQSL